METIVPASIDNIDRAAKLMRSGELVAFPTETVYGLGADARSTQAISKIFKVKGRPAHHPVIVHLAEFDWIEQWASHVPNDARRLAQAFWPGALTLILPRHSQVLTAVTGGQASVGLRVPNHPVALALLRAFGGGIAAPSANRFGCISPTTAAHVYSELGETVAMILDGGRCAIGIESTIIDCTSGEAVLLRPGQISLAALATVLGYQPRLARGDEPRAPGTLAAHYAPQTHTELISAEILPAVLQQESQRRIGVLALSLSKPEHFVGEWRQAAVQPSAYAHQLYATLRELDRTGLEVILIEAPPTTPEWLAIRDRLLKASYR